MRPFFLSLLAALPAAQAVFKDEVGHIDFHHELVGLPQQSTTFFHRPRRDDKASLLYTLSDAAVLGAINPSNGAVLWRQVLASATGDDRDQPRTGRHGHLRAAEGEGWVVSAYRGSVQAWDAISGRSVWSAAFPGEVRDLEVMEMTADSGRKDVLALFRDDEAERTTLRRLHGGTGAVDWEFLEASKDVPLQVSTNLQKVFVVSLHGSPGSYSLKVAVLDTPTGRRLDELVISAKGDFIREEDIMFVGANSATPIVAWTDASFSKLKVNVLGTKNKEEFALMPGTKSVDIHAPHLVQSDPHFLVHMRAEKANAAEVFHVDLKTSAITKAYDLPLQAGKGAVSTSSDGANVYFTRVTQSEVILVASTSHGILARWPLLAGGGGESLEVVHAVSEVVKKPDGSFAVRAAAVTDAEDWVLIRNGEPGWTRHEGLSGAVAGAFAEIPESEELARTLEAEAHSNPLAAYLHRLRRHAQDLRHFPDWLRALPQRFIDGVLGTETADDAAGHRLARDSFGFNKLAILATRRGRVFGLDFGHGGRIVWSLKAFDIAPGKTWDVKGIHIDDVKGLATIRGADGEYVVVSTDSGELVEGAPPGLSSPVHSTALVEGPAGPLLLTVDDNGKVGPLPAGWVPPQTIVVRASDDSELRGVRFLKGERPDGGPVQATGWTFRPPPGQKIVDVATRPAHDPVASIGRVLGDRRVLYKYLNPNTAVVAAADAAASTLSIYLLDTVSGEILSAARHEGVDTAKPISCVMAENFFVCTMFGEAALRDNPAQSIKGHLLAVTDLYESAEPNDRGVLGDGSAAHNASSLAPLEEPSASGVSARPHVVSQTFVLGGGPATALAVTSTRQGISSRQVLAYLPESRALAGLHRAALEPRRPVGRDPTAAEAEEGLARYAAAVEVDPRAVVSHERELVLGPAPRVVASPALVESTSLVLAFGLDVYGSRVAPSLVFDILGKGFSKVSLIGTVLALTAGVLALRPMVTKKNINMRWSAPS